MKFQINKKLLATAVLAVSGFMVSESAVACDPAQGSGQCTWDGIHHGGNPYPIYSSDYGQSGGLHKHKYVAVAFDKNAQPFIYHNTFRTADYVFADWEEAVDIVVEACNSDPNRSPCRYGSSATNKNCVAYVVSDSFMMSNAGSCSQTKKSLKQECKAYYNNHPACNSVKTARP